MGKMRKLINALLLSAVVHQVLILMAVFFDSVQEEVEGNVRGRDARNGDICR